MISRYFRVVILALLAALVSGCAFVNVDLVPSTKPLDEQVLEGKGKKKILILDVSGMISERTKSGLLLSKGSASMVDATREALKKAEQDDAIAGVIVRINSPGGTVTASDIIRHDLLQFKERRKVPVVACIMSIGASGGYYIATAADEIVAHPTAMTGSIGVLVMKFNVEGLMEKVGVREQTVKSGALKDMMSPFRPATPEEQKLAQDIIDSLYQRFLDVVNERPGNTLSRTQLQALADGRIYTAPQAVALKLIDRTGYLDDVINGMKQRLGLEEAKVVTYYRPGTYKGSIYAEAGEDGGLLSDFAGSAGLLPGSSFMYLWQP